MKSLLTSFSFSAFWKDICPSKEKQDEVLIRFTVRNNIIIFGRGAKRYFTGIFASTLYTSFQNTVSR
jgi:hypothetical protein